MKPTVYILIAVAGSGKSTYAAGLDAVVVSSDSIREELFGNANEQKDGYKVFQIFYSRAKALTDAGKNVVLDATNLTKKSRKSIYRTFGDNVNYVAIYFDIDIDTILERNAGRDRKVPEEVIRKMKNRLTYPNEEWINEVRIIK